jgi:muconolactone delta-isomerase
MLFLLDFRVEYPANMSQRDLFAIWAKEADAALAAKAEGAVVGLWKCAGTRRVIAIIEADSHDTLDRVLMDLPIMSEHGQHVRVEIVPLRRYEDFADDVRERLQRSGKA